MMTREQWILAVSITGLAVGALLVWLVLHVKRRVDAIHQHGSGVPAGDIGGIEAKLDTLHGLAREQQTDLHDKMNGLRHHVSSNYDTHDRKLDAISDATEDIAHGLEANRLESFAVQLAEKIRVEGEAIAKAKAAAADKAK